MVGLGKNGNFTRSHESGWFGRLQWAYYGLRVLLLTPLLRSQGVASAIRPRVVIRLIYRVKA